MWRLAQEESMEDEVAVPDASNERWTVRRAGASTDAATPSVRSLRAEMANLLAVSQRATRTELAHAQRRFHSRQFWLAAIATAAAGTVAIVQSLYHWDRAVDRSNLITFGCLCVITAAAIRALMSIRSASDQIPTAGPFGDEAPTA
jgi:hypothetical protein